MTNHSAEFVEQVFTELTDEEVYHAGEIESGSYQNRPRLKRVAEYCVRNWLGDIVEIGLGHGRTTKIFAEIARAHNRRVIAVDAFSVMGTAWGNDYFETFLRTVKSWQDDIDLIKTSSLDPETIRVIGERDLCFAYVDGLHIYEACRTDIQTVGHCKGIIAVDDIHIRYSYAAAVLRAFRDGAALLDRIPVDCEFSREGYLVPRE